MDDKSGRMFVARLERASWGSFLLWVGVCFLVEISWGVGFLGVAAIILGTQASRAAARIGIEGFWILVGCFFAVAGLWHAFGTAAEFGPIALVVVGAAFLLAAMFGKRHRHAD